MFSSSFPLNNVKTPQQQGIQHKTDLPRPYRVRVIIDTVKLNQIKTKHT